MRSFKTSSGCTFLIGKCRFSSRACLCACAFMSCCSHPQSYPWISWEQDLLPPKVPRLLLFAQGLQHSTLIFFKESRNDDTLRNGSLFIFQKLFCFTQSPRFSCRHASYFLHIFVLAFLMYSSLLLKLSSIPNYGVSL